MEHLRELITKLQLIGIPLKQGELMCRHTSFQIGGPVAVMVFPESEEQVGEIFRLSKQYHVFPMVLGAGTNVLPPDDGLDTMIIETKTGLNGIRDLGDGILEAQSGVTLARLATFAMERGFSGLEFSDGIPGTVGGGVNECGRLRRGNETGGDSCDGHVSQWHSGGDSPRVPGDGLPT